MCEFCFSQSNISPSFTQVWLYVWNCKSICLNGTSRCLIPFHWIIKITVGHFSFAINWKAGSACLVVYVIYWHFLSSVCETVYSTKTEAARVFPLLLWNTHMHMKLLTQTHTHAVDAVIERAGVSWEYESGSMTSLLFTGIRSSLVPTPPPPSLITLVLYSCWHA